MDDKKVASLFSQKLNPPGLNSSETGSAVVDNNAKMYVGTGPGDTATSKAEIVKSQQRTSAADQQLAKMAAIDKLDWKALPPPLLAQILSQIPYKGGQGEPDYYLTPIQALIFAMRAFELGLSPFSNEIWFNPKNNKANVSFEGKLKLARDKGMNFGPPHFARVEREASAALLKGLPQIGPAGKEPGIKCTITVQMGSTTEKAEYTAWLSEWYMARSPVWKEKPEHMLQLRAAEKCISFASGVGSSEMPGEPDIAPIDQPSPEIKIDSTEFEVK